VIGHGWARARPTPVWIWVRAEEIVDIAAPALVEAEPATGLSFTNSQAARPTFSI